MVLPVCSLMRPRIARRFEDGKDRQRRIESGDLTVLGAGREAPGDGREAVVGLAVRQRQRLFGTVRPAQTGPALGLLREHEAHRGALVRALGHVDPAREGQRLGAGGAQVGHVVHAVGAHRDRHLRTQREAALAVQ
ncbi:hypothetical protein ACI48D_19490 [Massilia sp. LXY-6]|uniref:hypothetical protein n=1 Tax=Massilia sp. LXY-6 TaxID=3379823 RepID=UPI003EE27F07